MAAWEFLDDVGETVPARLAALPRAWVTLRTR